MGIFFNTVCNLAHNIRFYRRMKKQTKRSKSTKAKKSQPKPKTKPVTKSKSKNKKVQAQQVEEKQTKAVQQVIGYDVQVDGSKYKVKMHKNYQVECESQIGKNIKNWVALLIQKQKKKSGKVFKVSDCTYYPTFEFELAGQKPQHQKCSICQFEYQSLTTQAMQKQLLNHNETDLVTLKCSHIMHYECLKSYIKDQQWVKCPVCSTIFGKMIGDQPPGSMTWNVSPHMHCDGYPTVGTITIDYSMNSGKRGNINFPGTHRVAYLPDNKEGNEVLQLLKQAFDRKLIFTIGRSVTTGRDNQVVWNGIHHKTNLSGGSAYFGYPDETYFQRVKLELAAKGVY